MKKKLNLFLFLANVLLLCLGWVIAFYSYPRLPERMPLWINFFKQETIILDKSPLFFLYPLIQTFYCFYFWLVSRIKKTSELMSLRGKISFPEKDGEGMALKI